MPADEMEELCRICVHKSHFYKNIYESHIFDDSLFKIINELCQLSIYSGDGMPGYVCVDCYNKVLDFGRFKRTSHMGRVMLLGMKMRLRQAQRNIQSPDAVVNGSESVCGEATEGPVIMCIVTQSDLEMAGNNVVIKPETIEEHETKEEFKHQIFITEAAVNSECGKYGASSNDLHMNMHEMEPLDWKPICDSDINQAVSVGGVYSIQPEGVNAEDVMPKEDFGHNVYIPKVGIKSEIWKAENEDHPQQSTAESEMAFDGFEAPEAASDQIVYKESSSNEVALSSRENMPSVEMGLNQLVDEVNPSEVQLDMMVDGGNGIPSIIFLGNEPKINSKEHACPKCGQGFSKKCRLEQHEKSMCQSNEYLCSYCGMRFAEKTVLSEHLRLYHSGVLQFERRVGGSKNAWLRQLTSYSFIEKLNKQLVCKYCEKVFTHSDKLNNHLKKHMEHVKDSIKYYCPGCNKAFVRQYYLTRHKRRCDVLN